LPPSRDRGAGQAKGRKPKAPSIRDAAASAAGSAGTPPPPFPDFDAPARQWDPWDPNRDTETDGRGGDFDPQRTLGEWLEAVIPPEAQVHFIRAGQEFAAGVQTTVEHHLGRGSGAAPGRDGASRIEIE
jgi:hypothetical protein